MYISEHTVKRCPMLPETVLKPDCKPCQNRQQHH